MFAKQLPSIGYNSLSSGWGQTPLLGPVLSTAGLFLEVVPLELLAFHAAHPHPHKSLPSVKMMAFSATPAMRGAAQFCRKPDQ
jgi:hypothetical protein